jgi:predicted PurR-regulated permease PerM
MDTCQYDPATSTTKNLLVATIPKKREIAMSVEKPKPSSPKWSSTFKMIIGLTIAVLFLAMLFYFRSIIGPLLLAFILVYLLHPLAAFLNTHLKLSWRASVSVIYIILLIILIAFSPLQALLLYNRFKV